MASACDVTVCLSLKDFPLICILYVKIHILGKKKKKEVEFPEEKTLICATI